MAELQVAGTSPAKRRPALKLVKTQALSRDQWLDVRKGGIGSSDAAAAVGLHPYKSPLQLWMEKTGRDALLPKVDPDDATSPMYWGTLLEPIVAAHYTRRTGLRVRRINAVLQHPVHPWMLANIDREVVGSPDVQILECKTAGYQGARLWEDGVPEYVQLQVLHQLAVTGKPAADVAVLICGQELRIHRIERDETMIAQLVELEQRFWRLVETDTAPPADGSESADLALRALWPRDNGKSYGLLLVSWITEMVLGARAATGACSWCPGAPPGPARHRRLAIQAFAAANACGSPHCVAFAPRSSGLSCARCRSAPGFSICSCAALQLAQNAELPGFFGLAQAAGGAGGRIRDEEHVDGLGPLFGGRARIHAGLRVRPATWCGIVLPLLPPENAGRGKGWCGDTRHAKDGFFLIGGEHVCLLRIRYGSCSSVGHSTPSAIFRFACRMALSCA